ncbi:MAG TPA: DsbE family thiol:disulfide interchange protein [Marinagarivorans sp.]|nr:DsbE family thiol:disulfide interchange protein [Cellvibrionaceae bacterium]HMY38711.1 DsbE family thiol:disulfide interchange protein [Marinagarivorans sp.]HNG61912.1 DsbE family thiol:disulfide interchange protein [Cellvibrionaceae bacterium]
MKRLRLFIPLIVFVFLSALLYWGMSRNPDELPSVLIGKPLPEFALSSLNNPAERITKAQVVTGKPFILNVWASWCPTCKDEHPFLNKLSAMGVKIVGINYKDDPDAAKAILARLNDPYSVNLLDPDGKLGIDLGVYGAPESFIVDANGMIVDKVVGAIDEQIWQQQVAKYFNLN